MKILICPDSFKGSLSSTELIDIISKEIKLLFPDAETVGIPIADGGEGTLDALAFATDCRLQHVLCKNPLFGDIDACFGILKDGSCVIEMAQASGLNLIPYAEGNAAYTTSFGTGELIKAALATGSAHLKIALGGSATNDGGIGAMAALGARFLDADGRELSPIGKNLINIRKIDTDGLIKAKGVRFSVLSDVDNPLLGEKGATRVFGKQKGASGALADELERGMENYASVLKSTFGIDVGGMPKTGAAGGLSAALIAFYNAKTESGIEALLNMVSFDELLCGADFVITGEGRFDSQSLDGKAISGICSHAAAKGVPVLVLAGSAEVTESEARSIGIRRIETLIDDSANLDDAIKNAAFHAKNAARKLFSPLI